MLSYHWSVILQSLKSLQHFNKKWGPIQSKEKTLKLRVDIYKLTG